MDKNKRKMGLGKGLNAIFSNPNTAAENNIEIDSKSFEIHLSDIEVNPFQPRTNFDPVALEELKSSIMLQGIIQPIAVRKISPGKFQIISGERRYQASKLAGLTSIPAYVKEATDIQMLEMGIIENIQRENLNPVEIALSFQRLLKECNIKQEELGERVGKDRTTINNYLRLLNLPKLVLDGLNEKKLTMGHARALLGLEDKKKIEKLFDEIVNKELSVRKVEELVKKTNAGPSTTKSGNAGASPKKKMTLQDYQLRFTSIFKKEISVQADENQKGEIKIPFNSKEELETILKMLKK
jgi:ParB family transcriptional regulator, chromosome partitioning protein